MAKLNLIGVTGGLGAGKSTVEKIFLQAGFPTLDFDRVVADVYTQDQEFCDTVLQYFKKKYSCSLVDSKGNINRKLIAEKVFGSDQDLKFLEKLIYPRVFERAAKWIAAQENIAIVFVPLLFESGYYKFCDITITIEVDQELRINRIMYDRGWTRIQCQERIAKQLQRGQRVRLADYTIDNNGSFLELQNQIQNLIIKLAKTNKP